MMMMTTKSQQDIIKYNNASNYPIASNFLSQFTNWAKIWMSSSSSSSSTAISKIKIPRKRKMTSTSSNEDLIARSRETDIRSRTNYYDQPQKQQANGLVMIPISQRAFLYRATCQKLRPNNNNNSSPRKLVHLGDILHVRKFWDNLEKLVYQDLSNTSHYVPPSKRLPFNPDKPGSIYLPRKSKRNIAAFTHLSTPKRRSFASSTIVYNNNSTTNNQHNINIIRVQPVIVPQEDDDDVPLGALHFSNSKPSPLRR